MREQKAAGTFSPPQGPITILWGPPDPVNARSDDLEVVRDYYCPPAPDVLVAQFGSLLFALDGDGLHVAILDPRTARK